MPTTPTPDLSIRIDDLSGPAIADFLAAHLADMQAVSPPESKHALDLDGLRSPDITFWSVYAGAELVGCGALKELNCAHAEIKSMRVDARRRGAGIGARLLTHLIDEARARYYEKLSLETGSMAFFTPARRLYENFGFAVCEPFANYQLDPNSVFYEYRIEPA